MTLINEAYGILQDVDKRKKYDIKLDIEERRASNPRNQQAGSTGKQQNTQDFRNQYKRNTNPQADNASKQKNANDFKTQYKKSTRPPRQENKGSMPNMSRMPDDRQKQTSAPNYEVFKNKVLYMMKNFEDEMNQLRKLSRNSTFSFEDHKSASKEHAGSKNILSSLFKLIEKFISDVKSFISQESPKIKEDNDISAKNQKTDSHKMK